ncbi:MAG: DMT family transporter, partial [Quisquiliibacterium sp.]
MNQPLVAVAAPLRGIALMVAACASFALLDATVKVLSERYPAPMIAWARYFFHVVILLVVLWPRYGMRLVRTRRPGLQLVRGVFLGASSLFFFSALAFLPLAESSALASVAPILVTIAAVRWLGEKPPPGAAWALGMSFAGVLLIIRPGTALFGWAALLPLCTAVCGAGYQLATRRLAGVDSSVTTLFLGGLVSVVLMVGVLPFYFTLPGSFLDALLFLLTGAIGAGGHMMLVRA